MKVTVLYVGSSLLGPLRSAEHELNRQHALDLRLAPYNFGGPFTEEEWQAIANDLLSADVVFVIHVMDGENATRLLSLLDRRSQTTIVINCMPELMKRTRLGRLDFARLPGMSRARGPNGNDVDDASLLKSISSWIGQQVKRKGKNGSHAGADYLKWAERLPGLLRVVPNAGRVGDAKNYLLVVSYFLQPTPQNIRAMILLALREYVDNQRLAGVTVPPPEAVPAVAIYHPDASRLFESFEEYQEWYVRRDKTPSPAGQSPQVPPADHARTRLDPRSTIGLLLMRPQIVSNTRKHYDAVIRAIEAEGLDVIPAISTFMDNRQACDKFFVGMQASSGLSDEHRGGERTARVSQIVSLTGFSFVGGPAMNDSEAAARYFADLNIPYRSLVSLDAQTIESWDESFTGLNPVQTGMQVAIPEIDGATEPFVFGGIPGRGVEPAALEDRCWRIARRLKRWHRLQTAPRSQLKIALVVYCFPPNKGNIGTAADLDVFASLYDLLRLLKREGYAVEVPDDADALREMVLKGKPKPARSIAETGENASAPATVANVAYRMDLAEYRATCPYIEEIEAEWGTAPGAINAHNGELLIEGIALGNVFIGVQPTFGFEDDPMRLLMARSGTPHHGFAAFYAYLERVFGTDAVVHVGTHGAMEFMPGKQVGLSERCWPDRLIGELPNIYIYSVNNPSEGTIAKRRSYAQLISYLTPPIENAGLYKGLATLKDLLDSYRMSANDDERARIFESIDEARRALNM